MYHLRSRRGHAVCFSGEEQIVLEKCLFQPTTVFQGVHASEPFAVPLVMLELRRILPRDLKGSAAARDGICHGQLPQDLDAAVVSDSDTAAAIARR